MTARVQIDEEIVDDNAVAELSGGIGGKTVVVYEESSGEIRLESGRIGP